jgi:hypothetical protein
MRKLIAVFVTILTCAAPAASATTGPVAPAAGPDTAGVGAPDTGLSPSREDLERAQARRVEAAKRRSETPAERRPAAPAVSVPPHLEAIAQCESGGDPGAVGGGGQFRGKYQFTYATWAAVGGQGDPAAAPEAEQDRRAAALYAQSGPGQWPVCGR